MSCGASSPCQASTLRFSLKSLDELLETSSGTSGHGVSRCLDALENRSLIMQRQIQDSTFCVRQFIHQVMRRFAGTSPQGLYNRDDDLPRIIYQVVRTVTPSRKAFNKLRLGVLDLDQACLRCMQYGVVAYTIYRNTSIPSKL